MANKVEFIDELVKEEVFKSKAEAERALTAVLETFETFLVKGEEVNFIGWGKFSVEERGERKGRNPQTGEEMIIPAKKTVKFKAGKKLAEKIK
ncbi:HU family DNA-binding protein [uncultured Fusobacterium sp.]|uniref:HU family DNA-binding protein n=1 Tax=uncultured Fusobacterium sp. TaxID=159267 RepID=UPI0015A59402|nr:HU family DNA-binding protein [uncultured Fusobacterium sp.]